MLAQLRRTTAALTNAALATAALTTSMWLPPGSAGAASSGPTSQPVSRTHPPQVSPAVAADRYSSYAISASGQASLPSHTDVRVDRRRQRPVPATAGEAQRLSGQRFVARCVGGERPALIPTYLGLSEGQARRLGATGVVRVVRVVGRDGTCLGRTRDYRADRVNLVVEGAKVIWAGRF